MKNAKDNAWQWRYVVEKCMERVRQHQRRQEWKQFAKSRVAKYDHYFEFSFIFHFIK